MIPELLRRNVLDNWPDAGPAWLARLPALIDEIAATWDLTITRPHRMTFHWVAAVRRANRQAVLKLGVPDGHLAAEAAALRVVDGDGAIRVLADDLPRGALLLEAAFPGTPLATLTTSGDDTTATAVLASVARRFHRAAPADGTLPHLRAFRPDLDAYLRRFPAEGPLPRLMVQRAAALFEELTATTPGEVLLHGDLHHENILRADREQWLAIDPFGLVGDPGWDAGSMLYNPYPERRDPELLSLVPARLEQLSDHDSPDRTTAWGFTAAVLSEVWSTMSNGGVNTRALDVATLLEPRLR